MLKTLEPLGHSAKTAVHGLLWPIELKSVLKTTRHISALLLENNARNFYLKGIAEGT